MVHSECTSEVESDASLSLPSQSRRELGLNLLIGSQPDRINKGIQGVMNQSMNQVQNLGSF